MKISRSNAPRVIILTGTCRSGKSTLLFALLRSLRRELLKVAGIIADGLWENGMRSGFNLLDLKSGVFTPLCRRSADGESRGSTPFVFFQEGMAAGEKALSIMNCSSADVVIVDEVGPLEIRGEGWAPYLPPLLALEGPAHLWVVRHTCLEKVQRKWGLEDAEIVDVKEPGAARLLKSFCMGNRRTVAGAVSEMPEKERITLI